MGGNALAAVLEIEVEHRACDGTDLSAGRGRTCGSASWCGACRTAGGSGRGRSDRGGIASRKTLRVVLQKL